MPARDWDAGEERDEDEVWAVGSVKRDAGGRLGWSRVLSSE